MKKLISLILGISFLFSLVGCNTKSKDKVFRASDDIKCTSSFYIRKGETVICHLPYPIMANNYQEFEEENLSSYMNVIIDEKNDELILSGYLPDLFVTCQKEFNKPIVINEIKIQIKDNSYVIVPIEYTFYFLEEEYLEPPFAPSYTVFNGVAKESNSLNIARTEGFYSTYDYVYNVWFYISPKRNNLEDAFIEIQSIEPMPNSISKLESVEYSIFTDVEDDFISCTNISYSLMKEPIFLNDKEYEIDECLVFKFTFSDTLRDNSFVSGGTLKLDVKINGDSYSLFRHYNYYRCMLKID